MTTLLCVLCCVPRVGTSTASCDGGDRRARSTDRPPAPAIAAGQHKGHRPWSACMSACGHTAGPVRPGSMGPGGGASGAGLRRRTERRRSATPDDLLEQPSDHAPQAHGHRGGRAVGVLPGRWRLLQGGEEGGQCGRRGGGCCAHAFRLESSAALSAPRKNDWWGGLLLPTAETDGRGPPAFGRHLERGLPDAGRPLHADGQWPRPG